MNRRNDPLTSLMRTLPRAAALVDGAGAITGCNEPFTELFGRDQVKRDVTRLAPPNQQQAMHALLAMQPGWRGAELPLNTTEGPGLFWTEVYTLHNCSGDLVRLISLHDVGMMRTMEAAYLHKIRKVADDNLWILDSSTTLLWARTSSPELDAAIGCRAHELVLTEDRAIWDKCIRKARNRPGTPVECAVRSSADGMARTVDVCYLSGGLFGGRFYVASRSTEPTGCRIVRRLKEAWQVRTDKDLADKLETAQSSISLANKSESVPPAWIVHTGTHTGASMDWIAYGQGQKRRW